MTVYVDDMRKPYGRMVMCHMGADTLEELHEMADKIGVERRHFQGDHYDICRAKRGWAVRAGAVQITQREMVRIVRRRKLLVSVEPRWGRKDFNPFRAGAI
jgi:hypothetical protein